MVIGSEKPMHKASDAIPSPCAIIVDQNVIFVYSFFKKDCQHSPFAAFRSPAAEFWLDRIR